MMLDWGAMVMHSRPFFGLSSLGCLRPCSAKTCGCSSTLFPLWPRHCFRIWLRDSRTSPPPSLRKTGVRAALADPVLSGLLFAIQHHLVKSVGKGLASRVRTGSIGSGLDSCLRKL